MGRPPKTGYQREKTWKPTTDTPTMIPRLGTTQTTPRLRKTPPVGSMKRDWFPDSYVPIFGYFGGGGWAFGRVETSTWRLDIESYEQYKSATDGQEIVLRWRASDDSGSEIKRTERVRVSSNPRGNELLLLGLLLPVDRAAFEHDLAHRRNRENLLLKYIDSRTALSKAIKIDEDLLSATRASKPQATPPLRSQYSSEEDFKQAKWLYQNELNYEKALENGFPAIIALQRVAGVFLDSAYYQMQNPYYSPVKFERYEGVMMRRLTVADLDDFDQRTTDFLMSSPHRPFSDYFMSMPTG